MTASAVIQFTTWLLYLATFVFTAVHAFRHPRRATIDVCLLFGAPAVVILQSTLVQWAGEPAPYLVTVIVSSLMMAIPYLLLRVLEGFSGPQKWVRGGAEVGLALSVAVLAFVPPPIPSPLVLLLTLYFVGVSLYVSAKFVRATGNETGVTRRRLTAASVGSVLLGLTILSAGVAAFLPDYRPTLTIASQVFGLGSGLGYVLAFAPPTTLRRAWQYPELRAFLARVAALPALPNRVQLVAELEEMTARVMGRGDASIGVWDPSRQKIMFTHHPILTKPDEQSVDDGRYAMEPQAFIGGRAFLTQRPVFVADAGSSGVPSGDRYRAAGIRAVMAAPITAGQQRLGVLSVYGEHEPIFGEDDLELLQMLATQCAVVLETRRLLEEAAEMAAREETSRIKEDFVSAAAHDLKTPLTVMLAQLQRLQRQFARDPNTADPEALTMVVEETRRLDQLVDSLLDVARFEEGRVVLDHDPLDLREVAEESVRRVPTDRHEVRLEPGAPVWTKGDRVHLRQVLDNLVQNAIKYSPQGGPIAIRVWQDGDEARLSVADRGIGIPARDLPHLFDRFHRGSNVDHRRFAGLGLGLYISRLIIEAQGGRIWADSTPGDGTTIHLTLPRLKPETGD